MLNSLDNTEKFISISVETHSEIVVSCSRTRDTESTVHCDFYKVTKSSFDVRLTANNYLLKSLVQDVSDYFKPRKDFSL